MANTSIIAKMDFYEQCALTTVFAVLITIILIYSGFGPFAIYGMFLFAIAMLFIASGHHQKIMKKMDEKHIELMAGKVKK